MDGAFGKSRAVATGLDRGIARRTGAGAITVEREDEGQFEQPDDLGHQITCAGGSLDEIPKKVDCDSHLAAEHMERDQGNAALVPAVRVAECVRKLHSLAGDRLGIDEIPRRERPVCLSAENLAQPPVVVH